MSSQHPASMRDAFYRLGPLPSMKHCDVVLPELADDMFPKGKYKDLLKFESDIAQISTLVVLFSESPGSFAELGAFALDTEIAGKILVFIEEYFHDQSSFIKHGPLLHLTETYGEAAVCVLDGRELGIRLNPKSKVMKISDVNGGLFKARVLSAIDHRLKEKLEPKSLIEDRRGHLIKVSVGIIQQFGGLTSEELNELLDHLQLKQEVSDLEDFLLCAEAVGWIKRRKRGLRTFFFALDRPDAMNFKFLSGAPHSDRRRWRLEIREHWKATDDERYQGIIDAVAEAA